MKVSALPHCLMLCIIAAAACLAKDVPDLLDAVKRRDHKALKALIKARADVNVAQPDGATALAWAIYLDDQEAAEMLLAAGAKVNTADEYGETPL
ncbi:MAG TPA: ankyrin repeat domain-containing protein, partial [Blastocatellia bacterium]|nr:ankyrin repeat domain-containing protein [Blastocatellia bacterium]